MAMEHKETSRVLGYCCFHHIPIGSSVILNWRYLLTFLASLPTLLPMPLSKPQSHCKEAKSPSPKAPAQTPQSQLHRQQGTAKKPVVLVLFPSSLPQTLSANSTWSLEVTFPRRIFRGCRQGNASTSHLGWTPYEDGEAHPVVMRPWRRLKCCWKFIAGWSHPLLKQHTACCHGELPSQHHSTTSAPNHPLVPKTRRAAKSTKLTLDSRVRSPPRRSSRARALLSASRAFSSAETHKGQGGCQAFGTDIVGHSPVESNSREPLLH